ncbi:MAG: ABC transporter permease subunit [Clostridia bacterium]|nr:ABC transporter permease subunit [Clostridia bacterium]
MKTLFALIRKELLEQLRSGRLLILGILFVLLGILGPATAKLTPWIYEMLADSMAESGMTITPVPVTALDAWVQFFKNLLIGIIAFVLLESGIFTREYQSGTLVLSLTKGLERHKVVIAKAVILVTLWTLGYWLCAGVTYGYAAYYWDNSVVKNLLFSLFCSWMFGLWLVALMILFSTLSTSNTGVLAGVGGAVILSYLLAMLPKISEYLPTLLTDGTSLIYGSAEPSAYTASLIIVAAMISACFAASIAIFNRKQL